MPTITLQLGQCGNQLGCSFFNTLATEFSSHDYGSDAVHEYYRPSPDPNLYTARSVLIDMEPKVGRLRQQRLQPAVPYKLGLDSNTQACSRSITSRRA